MKNAVILIAASAALASAQLTIDPSTGKYKCPKPNVAYCAGSSLKTDIIVRCDSSGNGQAGRCGANLSGRPPIGNTVALCYQTNEDDGDAACAKNCVVYGDSGNGKNGTFTLPPSLCTPSVTTDLPPATASSSSTSGTPASSKSSTTTTGAGTSSSITTVVDPPLPTTSQPTTAPPPPPVVTLTSTLGPATTNGNVTLPRPTTSSQVTVPNMGAASSAGGALAFVGMLAAYLL